MRKPDMETFETSGKKINVMVVTPTLECGGAERFVSLFCNNNDNGILQLTLVVINNKLPFYKIDNSAVKIINLGTERVSRSLIKLKTCINQVKPDIVFTTSNHLNLYISIFKFLFSNNIIWIARETSVVSINSKYSRHPDIYRLLLKTFYKKIDHIICQSVYMQKDLVKNYHIDINKTSVIYNAVDPAMHKYEGTFKQNSFITVARLSAEKGIDKLIRTMATLNIPYNYSIVGNGPEKESLLRLTRSLGIEERVQFSGQLEKPFSGKEDSQIYLLGSLYEGFPNSVIEANALGIPVVSKNIPGGTEEIITDAGNGFIAVDDDDFRKKILIATTFPFNRKQISESTIKRFSIDKMMNSIVSLFSELNSLKKK